MGIVAWTFAPILLLVFIAQVTALLPDFIEDHIKGHLFWRGSFVQIIGISFSKTLSTLLTITVIIGISRTCSALFLIPTPRPRSIMLLSLSTTSYSSLATIILTSTPTSKSCHSSFYRLHIIIIICIAVISDQILHIHTNLLKWQLFDQIVRICSLFDQIFRIDLIGRLYSQVKRLVETSFLVTIILVARWGFVSFHVVPLRHILRSTQMLQIVLDRVQLWLNFDGGRVTESHRQSQLNFLLVHEIGEEKDR